MKKLNKIVNVKIIRHSRSTANEFREINGIMATDLKYRNSELSPKGIDMINKKRNELKKNLGNPDLIILSPLKRAIQTFLFLYDDEKLDKEVRIMPLFSEIHTIIENKGVSRTITKNDSDMNKQPNFNLIDFTNSDDNLFFYDNGWKKVYENGWKNNPINLVKNVDGINSLSTWVDLEPKAMNDGTVKTNMIKKFLTSDYLTGKDIVIFSHFGIIELLTGINSGNLGIVSFTFDQDTQTIANINRS